MEISIIIVNWNSVDYLRECLRSIYEFTHNLEFEIIIVDNASPEPDVDELLKDFPAIKIIKSRQNLGFAGANNLGFQHSNGEFALFLNPDTKLVSPAINQLLVKIKSLPDAGVVGCKLLNSNLSIQLSSIQKFPKIWNQVLDIESLQLRWPGCPLWDISPLFSDKPEIFRVEMISGACMLLRRSVFQQVAMFNEEYFMYAEDIDLNFKVHRAGYQNYYVADTSIIHHGGGSSSRQRVNQWKTLMKYRAMRMYYHKMYGRPYEEAYRAAMGLSAAFRLAILGLAYPVGVAFRRKESFLVATDKWKAILKWAIGLHSISPENK
jgi:GT2 family glycosyltransferase